MTYTFATYNRQTLDQAFKQKGTFSFSLGTNDINDLGISHTDDVAQVIEGGRFDLTPWRKNPPRRALLNEPSMTAREILHDASFVVGHLYLQYEQSGGENATGDISATYNPLETPAPRLVTLDPAVP